MMTEPNLQKLTPVGRDTNRLRTAGQRAGTAEANRHRTFDARRNSAEGDARARRANAHRGSGRFPFCGNSLPSDSRPHPRTRGKAPPSGRNSLIQSF